MMKCLTQAQLIVLSFLMMDIASAAQSQADIDAANQEAFRRQQLEQQRQERDRSDWEDNRAPSGADLDQMTPQLTVERVPVCRDIKTIVINGTTQMAEKIKKQIAAPFINQCLGATDIEKLLAEITAFYIKQGFITARAYLPAQDLSTGTLEILVVEGAVEKIELDDGGKKSVFLNNAFPNMTGKLLNLRDVEQGIDQINRLQSNRATMEIIPGDKPGMSKVVIRNEPSRTWRLNFSADNQGSRSTGRRQVSAGIMLDNPLGFNDFFNLTHRLSHPEDWERKMSRSDSVDYNFPLGYNTFSLNHSFSKYVSTIVTSGGESLKSNGDSRSTALGIERVVYRNQDTRATLSAKLTNKGSNNYLADSLLEVSSRTLTILDVDGTYTTSVWDGIMTSTIGFARGLDIFSALKDNPEIEDSAPHAQFTKIKYNFNYMRPFKIANLDASFKSAISGQFALDTLYGSEQQLVGGIYTVRGFIDNTVSGDNGYYWTNEISLRAPFTISKTSGSIRPYIGIDHGRATNRHGNAPDGSITGMGTGFSLQVGIVTFDLMHTRPLAIADHMIKPENGRTYFSVKLAI